MKKYFIALWAILTCINAVAQEPIQVTDQTIKIKGTKEEEIMLGFAEGDKVIFNFREINNKDLKEVEVIEYPSSSKFSDFKTSKIENKTFAILKSSVYIFRFKNSALGGRVCKISIQRIPANESTRNYNTSVQWIDKQDTSWNTYTKDVVIGYDTIYQQKTRRDLIRTEQKEELLVDKPQRVHSETNSNGNKTSLFFTLPQNESDHNKTTTVIAWAYWVGVGKEANEAWRQNVKAFGTVAKGLATSFTSPLGGFAVGLLTDLMTPRLGEDVTYGICNEVNRNLFLNGQPYRVFDNGKGVAGYRKFTDKSLCQGRYFICLLNDNYMLGIDATVKVSAIVETNYYEDKQYTDQIINAKYEKQLFKEPVIKTNRVPVGGI